MNPTHPENPAAPVWAREDAFPIAPPGCGWADAKGGLHPCDSTESLANAIRDDRDGSVTLVWAPSHPRMLLPEELGGMGEALRTARTRWTGEDLEESKHRLRWFGAALAAFSLWAFFHGFLGAGELAENSGLAATIGHRLALGLRSMFGSTHAGLALLMYVIFAFIPWWQARKRRAELGLWSDERISDAAPTIRFETWLDQQRAPFTKAILGLVVLVAIAQILSGVKTSGWGSLFAIFGGWDGISAAGLMKERYVAGEWWRLLTAPLLHGNLLHFLMNAAALAYLGKRLEVFARWPHLPLVFLFAACIGGEASVRFIAAPSVGASGGLMGWLGFLLVFETLHKNLIPRRARRRLAAGVALTALIGIIGYRFIDNAAHAGGLLAGMAYAAIVFPKSSSPERPGSTLTDKLAGGGALAVLVTAALFAAMEIL